MVELLEVFEELHCVLDEGHDPHHTLGDDGQKHLALSFLGLVDHTVVKADDGFQELVVAAVLG